MTERENLSAAGLQTRETGLGYCAMIDSGDYYKLCRFKISKIEIEIYICSFAQGLKVWDSLASCFWLLVSRCFLLIWSGANIFTDNIRLKRLGQSCNDLRRSASGQQRQAWHPKPRVLALLISRSEYEFGSTAYRRLIRRDFITRRHSAVFYDTPIISTSPFWYV